MPSGNISNKERFKRLSDVKQLLDEDKSVDEIVDETGYSLTIVKKTIKYLDDLSTIDLNPEEIGNKREELYLELLEATEEAKSLFEKYKDANKAVNAKMFFSAWLEAINMRAKLYGLDRTPSQPTANYTQNNFYEKEKIDPIAGSKIADLLKKNHEDSRR